MRHLGWLPILDATDTLHYRFEHILAIVSYRFVRTPPDLPAEHGSTTIFMDTLTDTFYRRDMHDYAEGGRVVWFVGTDPNPS